MRPLVVELLQPLQLAPALRGVLDIDRIAPTTGVVTWPGGIMQPARRPDTYDHQWWEVPMEGTATGWQTITIDRRARVRDVRRALRQP